jgi:hypothetical protein
MNGAGGLSCVGEGPGGGSSRQPRNGFLGTQPYACARQGSRWSRAQMKPSLNAKIQTKQLSALTAYKPPQAYIDICFTDCAQVMDPSF